jgi:hypothetical protein
MLTLLFSLRDCFRARAALQAEILALRHQLLALQRSNRGRRLRLSRADRVLWVWLSRLWNDWRSALLIVKPETVIAWHRKGFQLYWNWKSRHLEGRRRKALRCGNPTSLPTMAHFCRMKRLSPTRIRASQRALSLSALTHNKTPFSTSSVPPPRYSLARVRSRRLLPCSTAQSPQHSTPLSPPIQFP